MQHEYAHLISWLELYDEICGTHYIRKPTSFEIKNILDNNPKYWISLQIFNWFQLLQDNPPLPRGSYINITSEIFKGVVLKFYDGVELKEEFKYLEDLYDSVREEK